MARTNPAIVLLPRTGETGSPETPRADRRSTSALQSVWRRLRVRIPAFRAESLLPELLAIGCFLILPWVGIAVTLDHEWQHARTAAFQSTANLARALEESTRRTIGQIDYALLNVRALRATQGDYYDFDQWVRSQTFADRMTGQIAVADRNGVVIHSNKPLLSRIYVGDQRRFQIHLDPAYDALFIDHAAEAAVSGLETVQFTRKLVTADGTFAGVAAFALSSGEMARFYEGLRLGEGFVAIASADGTVLARGPWLPGIAGARISAVAAAGGMLTQPYGSMELPANANRGAQIASFRRLLEYPVIVMIGFDTNTVFAPYRAQRTNALLAGTAITLTVGLVGLLWVRQKQRSLASRRALTVTLDTISQGILMVDGQGSVSVINPRALDMLRRPDEEREAAMAFVAARAGTLASTQTLGTPTLATPVPAADAPADTPNSEAAVQAAAPRQDSQFEAVLDNGTIIGVRTHVLADGGFVQTYTDVTEQRLAHAETYYLAHHDSLTGLANRAELLQRIEAVIGQDGGGASTGLVMIDLDGFKRINDTLGHDVGDALLVETGRRLRTLVRNSDVVARLGGDEFVVLLPRLNQPHDIRPFAERMLRRLAQPTHLQGHQVRIGASLGIAFYPQDGLDAASLLKHADMALHAAKTGGRGTYRCYNEHLSGAMTEHHLLESELRRALDGDELEVYFQPKFSCDTLEIVGFEALARWRHPTRGFVSPAVFIGIAEDCGLISRLGGWVLDQACQCVAGWAPRYPVAVNVSVVQLREGGLKDHIATVLARNGLQPEHLEIEVTESVMAGDDDAVLDNLLAIKAMGIPIAMDDFGTGYSSLSYLRRFVFDKIKIDRSFVQGQADDQRVRIILDAILSMCGALGLATIGEGVETEEQLGMLRDRGCTEVQGYLLGRPMPASEVQGFIRRHLHDRLAAQDAAGAVAMVA